MQRLGTFVVLCLCLASCGPAERSVVVHALNAAPERLSEWGVLYTSGGQLRLNDRVVPYDLNMPLFSDYALKLRTVWLPEGTAAQYRAADEFELPVGTIISKTFHYRKAADWSAESPRVIAADHGAPAGGSRALALQDNQLVETRLLVRYEQGWRALPYVWNEAQDDAFLEVAGDIQSLELLHDNGSRQIAYVVPDANQCAGCHTPDHGSRELRPIGPRAWQLNRDFDYATGTANQLGYWQEQGILAGVPVNLPAGTSWQEPADASLEMRARAYLDANCAHCHNPAGAADTSALHLNIEAPVDRDYGVCKPPVAVGRGSGDRPYDIYPGRPDESILLYRMQHTDPAIAMPELGRATVHTEAVALIRDWIAGMNGEC